MSNNLYEGMTIDQVIEAYTPTYFKHSRPYHYLVLSNNINKFNLTIRANHIEVVRSLTNTYIKVEKMIDIDEISLADKKTIDYLFNNYASKNTTDWWICNKQIFDDILCKYIWCNESPIYCGRCLKRIEYPLCDRVAESF
jgi:hypothetical protein